MHSTSHVPYREKVHTVERAVPVRRAVELMTEHGIGSVLVVEAGRAIGIFTERDLLRRVVYRGLDPALTPVEAVMSTEVAMIGPESRVDEALRLMRDQGIRHLPIAIDGEVQGIVSLSDLGHVVSDDNRVLVDYITGGYPR
jgi:CBS domain-containing protein